MTAVNWRPVPGWPTYAVSDNGLVRGPRGWVLKATPMRTGHRRVRLLDGERERWALVHVLVLEAFVGSCPPGMECCHGDGDPDNNRLSNLRWDTHRANMLDAVRHGTHNFLAANR